MLSRFLPIGPSSAHRRSWTPSVSPPRYLFPNSRAVPNSCVCLLSKFHLRHIFFRSCNSSAALHRLQQLPCNPPHITHWVAIHCKLQDDRPSNGTLALHPSAVPSSNHLIWPLCGCVSCTQPCALCSLRFVEYVDTSGDGRNDEQVEMEGQSCHGEEILAG